MLPMYIKIIYMENRNKNIEYINISKKMKVSDDGEKSCLIQFLFHKMHFIENAIIEDYCPFMVSCFNSKVNGFLH